MARFDQMMPVIRSTWSLCSILSAICTASSGFIASSSVTIWISLLPDFFMARSKASRTSTPSPAPPPESVVITPILIGSAKAEPAMPIASAMTPAASIFFIPFLPLIISTEFPLQFRTQMPQFRKEFHIQHLAQVGNARRSARPALQSDDPLHRRHMIEPPAAEIILEIDQLLGQFVEAPIFVGLGIGAFARALGRRARLALPAPVGARVFRADMEAVARQQQQRFVIEARAGEDCFKYARAVGLVRILLQHRRIAVA